MRFNCFSVMISSIALVKKSPCELINFCVLTTTESRMKTCASKMHLSPPVAKAAVRSKAVVLLLLFYCLMYFPLFVGFLCLSLICYALLYVHSSFAIILNRKRKLVALLSSRQI